MQIDRAFVRLDEGLVHYYHAGGEAPGSKTLYLIHLSPYSARELVPLFSNLRTQGLGHRLIAPDTLGNGDSAPPRSGKCDIAYFADSVRRIWDELGIDRADVYGTHTGARIAAELALLIPDRVDRLILDGITDYDAALKAEILNNYAPSIRPDDWGGYLAWAFNFIRDQAFFFPHFKKDAEHRLVQDAMPASLLHTRVLDLLKSLETYHIPYLAAFEYAASRRLPQIQSSTILLVTSEQPPNLQQAAVHLAATMRDSRVVKTAGPNGKATAIAEFLSRQTAAR